MSQIASFRAKLSPLTRYLDDPAITEIAINRPGELWLAKQGERYMARTSLPELSLARLRSLAEVTASYTSQEADRERPLLSATMPIDLTEGVDDTLRGGYRVQVVLPPTVEEQTIALCIRKPALLDIALADYRRQGAFASVNRVNAGHRVDEPSGEPCSGDDDACAYSDQALQRLYRDGAWEAFLRGAVRAHKNIVISAGTNTGKTTFLNALLKEMPEHERVVTIEDCREIRPPQPNCLHLVYSRGWQGLSKVTATDLLEAVLRLSPDRAIMGELRGAEA